MVPYCPCNLTLSTLHSHSPHTRWREKAHGTALETRTSCFPPFINLGNIGPLCPASLVVVPVGKVPYLVRSRQPCGQNLMSPGGGFA